MHAGQVLPGEGRLVSCVYSLDAQIHQCEHVLKSDAGKLARLKMNEQLVAYSHEF